MDSGCAFRPTHYRMAFVLEVRECEKMSRHGTNFLSTRNEDFRAENALISVAAMVLLENCKNKRETWGEKTAMLPQVFVRDERCAFFSFRFALSPKRKTNI